MSFSIASPHIVNSDFAKSSENFAKTWQTSFRVDTRTIPDPDLVSCLSSNDWRHRAKFRRSKNAALTFFWRKLWTPWKRRWTRVKHPTASVRSWPNSRSGMRPPNRRLRFKRLHLIVFESSRLSFTGYLNTLGIYFADIWVRHLNSCLLSWLWRTQF